MMNVCISYLTRDQREAQTKAERVISTEKAEHYRDIFFSRHAGEKLSRGPTLPPMALGRIREWHPICKTTSMKVVHASSMQKQIKTVSQAF